MDAQLFAEHAHHFQTVAIATLFFAICFFFPKISYQTKLAKIPAVETGLSGEKQRQHFLSSAQKIYDQGHAQFKDCVYRILNNDNEELIVIPPRFLPEIRKLPDDVLSLPKAIEKFLEVKYTKFLHEAPVVIHSIKADLTPALTRLNSVIYAEVDEAVNDDLPPCEDWTSANVYGALCVMVAKVSGRMFVGPEVCRKPEYIESAIQYTVDMMGLQQAVKEVRPWLRPLLVPRLPAYKQLRLREQKAVDLLEPIVAARLEAEKNDPDYKRPDDMLAWFMSRSDSYGGHSVAELAKMQLSLIFAAIHTTTMTATNTLYTLASTPQYIEELREEIRDVLAANGGTLTTRALQQMVKLDSYMKETGRVHTTGLTTFFRKVMRGFTLSNGQYIPAGAKLEISAHAIHNDPSCFPNSDVPLDQFDPWRFAKLRGGSSATANSRNQFVTANEQNLFFGYGAHACPGRFFANNEIKMILAKMILEYDFKYEDGVKERHPNIALGIQRVVDPTKTILIKKVQN